MLTWPLARIAVYSPHLWGSDIMATVPDPIPLDIEKTMSIAKAAQIAAFVRENQILTAVVLFALWQAGIFFTAIDHAQGAIC